MELSPFHLAVPTHSLEAARDFYTGILGCSEGRSSKTWVDFNFFGHQLVCHFVQGYNAANTANSVDGDPVPVPHFGLALKVPEFLELAERVKDAGVKFIIEPHIRFAGQAGEQWTMFFQDHSGNSVEFKAMTNPANLFAKYHVQKCKVMALRMMVLDMRLDEADSAPPKVFLYGITSDGDRVCCTVDDFLPYFWFPLPVLSPKEHVGEKLGLLTDLLNNAIASSKKFTGGPVVAVISLERKTPLMYYRQGGPFLFLKVEVSRSKLLPLAAKTLSALAERSELKDYGLVWNDTTCYEENIKFGMRFCCNTHVAGGAWVEIKDGQDITHAEHTTRCGQHVRVSWRSLTGLTADATTYMEPLGGSASSDRASDEVNSSLSVQEDCTAIPALRVLGLHVLCSWHQEKKMTESGKLDCVGVCDEEDLGMVSCGNATVPSKDPVVMISNILTTHPEHGQRKVVFMHRRNYRAQAVPGVEVRTYNTEAEMLLAWEKFVHSEADPDVICLYQLRDVLRYLLERFKVLKLGSLDISRFKGRATQVKSVVTYGKHWVKQQARMSATSNQEVFRAVVEGRIVIDMLRVVLVSFSLSTFTLGECSQVLLNKTKEFISLAVVSKLMKGDGRGVTRLIYYSLKETEVTLELMHKLQAIPETVEMARVTGLGLSDVLYKAQMIRVQSLLLRSARKEGWLLGGPTLGGQLSESPFLLHPIEEKTAGFCQNPVCILDFASLYPSVFMAYNLCYTTFVCPEDVRILPAESLYASPTGAHFVKKEVRHGVMPRICGALIRARTEARDKMAKSDISSEERAVLDGRQRALKLCSNALYGFTGAGASPQQALPVADSCLSIGALSCKQAVNLVGSTVQRAKVVYAQTDSVFFKLHGATVEEAVAIGKEVSNTISEAFPDPINLKFERVLFPFLLLQVNRYAGRQYVDNVQDDENGTLFVRGLESERRDVPYFVRRVCKSVLDAILIRGDVEAAVAEAKKSIKELVSGKLSMFELLMTRGLWRVDNNDITRLACTSKSPRKDARATAEDGRGPHVALAVRLKRKNPDRQFHIGERIPYVLVSTGSKLQDEMAEDPITALAEELPLNVHVYLENKLRKPLESILEHVVPERQMKDLFSVNHIGPYGGTGSRSRASVSNFFKRQPLCLVCRNFVADEEAVLCESCLQNRLELNITSVLLSQRLEEERKYTTHAECLRCHSGGLTGNILCTNTDCALFYLRYESCKKLEHVDSLLLKLANMW